MNEVRTHSILNWSIYDIFERTLYVMTGRGGCYDQRGIKDVLSEIM